ncbi:hypothetical protein [Actinotalea sp. JY-7876]|uniref:hypothetical protein n=1 Tax=Actinotalea sp. JY-7876 TaxID=2758442 RepID=UPI0015F6FF26|nr:hypothetical protein [Actinotalea sp. JY-7876]
MAAGRLAERHHLGAEVDDPHDIVVQLAASRAPVVADALLRVLGPRETFWSLAWSVEEDAVFPVSDRDDDVEPNLATPARGYAWVDQGMKL